MGSQPRLPFTIVHKNQICIVLVFVVVVLFFFFMFCFVFFSSLIVVFVGRKYIAHLADGMPE